MENSVDSAHPQILHQETANRGRTPANTTRGFLTDIELDSLGYYEYPFGIMKQRTYAMGISEEHPLIFPNILREGTGTHIRVPVDDTHTWIWYVTFLPDKDGRQVKQGDPPHEYYPAYKDPPDKLHPFTRIRMDRVDSQDYMVWETQGPIANREPERLATTDRGVVLLREMLAREISKVEQGLEPIGIVRDPDHAMIDTNLDETIHELRARGRNPSVAYGAV
jgi:5,5'-dehydrodivanillate O-demethylase